MGLRVWSGGEIFSKKINKKWRAHKAPPIITKVNTQKSSARGPRPWRRRSSPGSPAPAATSTSTSPSRLPAGTTWFLFFAQSQSVPPIIYQKVFTIYIL